MPCHTQAEVSSVVPDHQTALHQALPLHQSFPAPVLAAAVPGLRLSRSQWQLRHPTCAEPGKQEETVSVTDTGKCAEPGKQEETVSVTDTGKCAEPGKQGETVSVTDTGR